MKKLILLILYFAAYSIADDIKEVDVHQFVYNQMSDDVFFEEYNQVIQAMKVYNNLDKRNIYRVGSKIKNDNEDSMYIKPCLKCFIIKEGINCPIIKNNTFYYSSYKFKHIELDMFETTCIDTTKFYIVRDENRFYSKQRNNKDGFHVLKIPELKSIKWKLYKDNE